MRAPLTGKLIKRQRLKRRMTQVELSNLLQCSSGQYVSNIERGSCIIPVKKIPLLCTVLMIPKVKYIRAMVKDTRAFLFSYLAECR